MLLMPPLSYNISTHLRQKVFKLNGNDKCDNIMRKTVGKTSKINAPKCQSAKFLFYLFIPIILQVRTAKSD